MIPAENLRSIENEISSMISLCGKTITNDANEFFPGEALTGTQLVLFFALLQCNKKRQSIWL